MGTNEDNHGNVVETGIWLTSLPTCRETLRAEKSQGYFDFKHLKLHISL